MGAPPAMVTFVDLRGLGEELREEAAGVDARDVAAGVEEREALDGEAFRLRTFGIEGPSMLMLVAMGC